MYRAQCALGILSDDVPRCRVFDLKSQIEVSIYNNLSQFSVECPVGFYSDGATCQECPQGTYQSETGKTYCISCQDGQTTGFNGSSSVSDCSGIFKLSLLFQIKWIVSNHTRKRFNLVYPNEHDMWAVAILLYLAGTSALYPAGV